MKVEWRSLMVQFVALLCLVPAVMLVVQNWNVVAPVTLGQVTWQHMPVGAVALICALLVSVSLLARVSLAVKGLQDVVRRFDMKREQAEASHEASSDAVKALEAKIKTLETALDKALSRSSQA